MSKRIDFLLNGPQRNAKATIVLAHGAGAPMDSPFMNIMAESLANLKYKVVRFEFPYMADIRHSGKKKPPNTARILNETWMAVIEDLNPEALIIGGKSMGGRVASMVAEESGVAACVCLGYPFHPPGKPEKLRTEHLEKIKTPTLIVQGERDTFGTRDEVAGYTISKKVKTAWMPDGDHSFKPRKASGLTLEDNLALATREVDKFASKLIR